MRRDRERIEGLAFLLAGKSDEECYEIKDSRVEKVIALPRRCTRKYEQAQQM